MALAAVVTPVAGQEADSGTSIVGAWKVSGVGTSDTAPQDPLLFMFNTDGTVTVASRAVRPALPGSPFSYTSFSTGIGAWETTADGSTAFTVEHIVTDETGAFQGTNTLSGALHMSKDGLTVEGDATSFAYSTGGALSAEVLTPLKGTRIVVAPVTADSNGLPPTGPTTTCLEPANCIGPATMP
jgi:hypothetical protein